MTPPPNSSSRSGASGTSSTPTPWTRRLALHFLLPALAALAGVAVAVLFSAVGAEPPGTGAAMVVALGALVAIAIAVALARRMAERLESLAEMTRALGGGRTASGPGGPARDALGYVEEHLAAAARHVTATIDALRVGQERLEAILRSMVEGVLVTDLTGGVVLMNERAHALLDVPPGLDGYGRPLVHLARDPALAELMHDLADRAAIVSRDVTLGGGERTVQVNAAHLRAADGKVFGYVLVLHDVSELRRLEVVRRDFVANVSHELRTPLTAIKGYAETLLGEAGDDRATARRFLEVIDRHSERLGRLIDDLLTLSDLELGRAELRVAPVVVAAVVEDVEQIFAARVERAGVRLISEVAPDTPPVLGDGDRLRQVLINLVDNAVKYTSPGGRVWVRAGRASGPEHHGMVEIAVEDTGTGIPAQDLPRLSERFFRVDKARSRALGGTGLGLAIVKHIVQAHGGALLISSTVGEGTSVRAFFRATAGDLALASPGPESR